MSQRPSRHHTHPQQANPQQGWVDTPDGAPDRLAAKVAALRRPQAYPGEVRTVEALETHMSWVFLTRTRAYKLKKPVRTPLLDYTSCEARRHGCEQERALNQRLAASVYLGVTPLVESSWGIHIGGEGATVDWLVEMRRLADPLMLDACIERGEVRPDDVAQVAAKLCGFYADAHPAPTDAATYLASITSDIEAKQSSLAQPHYGLARREVARAAQNLLAGVDAHRAELEARADRIVDAHGDLRPEHVCLEFEPVIIDRLEFDRSLRLLDPASELAFLAMECRRMGAGWIADELFATYRRLTDDAVSEALFGVYGAYHALVRAAIAAWHLDDDALDDSERHRRRARRYFGLIDQLS
ncbi:hypothetical protein FIV42_07255 [Persicimonas caeni]|uniref:Aminoglycoside phosphotransferase domain-containing protein n=1 Tax=Persicimonas caeni TaxID=2292766 RepID=A0A4Y6PQC4_PERCE|nr:hypothetical protein [Persicimonas caeni]QDG50536.1 hypothetical protein FIV42_07255 [Persicimonas caeni]QED31757.1 hypothetical protein FRD00_07250 [Persicimonas caeni]